MPPWARAKVSALLLPGIGTLDRLRMAQEPGVNTPVSGFLADHFRVPEGGKLKTAELIHPKVEPEIAFVTRAPLRGPGCHIGAVPADTDPSSPPSRSSTAVTAISSSTSRAWRRTTARPRASSWGGRARG